MMEIVTYPDPVLMTQCRTITEEEIVADMVDGMKLTKIIAEMGDLLRSTANGVGLAAPQVGLPIRLFIVDLNREESPMVLINPAISNPRGTKEGIKEGCLSLPGIEVLVNRPPKVMVSGRTYVNGKVSPIEFEADGIMARVCQHELDHINGFLIVHKTGMIGTRQVAKQMEQLEREYAFRIRNRVKKA